MKTILLLRHAKSSWDNPGLADFERPLAKRGKKDAPRMGQVLADFDNVPDLIISSPAKRAKQTAELAAKHCGYTKDIRWEESFYHGSSHALIRVLQSLPEKFERVMLVGHNPTMEETAAELLSLAEDHWEDAFAIRMPTAALVCIQADIFEWSTLEAGDGVLQWFLIPRLVKAIT